MTLDKVQIRHSAIGNRIVLARFGKDPTVALATRDAMNDFLQTLVSFAFDGSMPEHGQAAEIDFGAGDEQFTVIVKRKKMTRQKDDPS